MSEHRKQIIKVIEQGTEIQSILIRDIVPFKNDSKKFVKIYADLFPILPHLDYYEIQILFYIIANLKMKSKTIALKPGYFKFHRQTFYKSIKGLIQWDIINKSNSQTGIYIINTNYLFNGKI